ncbi:hypothetical protein Agub_g1291, partial [Astrephomene gubernaculifera]
QRGRDEEKGRPASSSSSPVGVGGGCGPPDVGAGGRDEPGGTSTGADAGCPGSSARAPAGAVEACGWRHVVVATSTASGKSLCYLVPLLQALSSDPDSCALLLFPTKALAQDQLRT